MSQLQTDWLRAIMDNHAELAREKLELEEHIDRCERLLRCWCKPRTFGDAEDLREETKTFLNIKS